MKILIASSLSAVLSAPLSLSAQPPPREPLFEVEGAFLDAVVHAEHLYLLAKEVAPGKPDILVKPLGTSPDAKVGHYVARYAPLTLTSDGDWLLLSEGDHGIEVVDARDPAKPERATHFPLEGYAHRALLRRGTAFVASGFGGLHSLDIRDPARPTILSSFQAYPTPEEMAAVDSETETHRTREQSPPSFEPMQEIGEESGYFRPDDLPAYEGLEEEISAYDIRDREGALDVAVSGNNAYLAYGSAGVVILDVADPHNPLRIGGYATNRPAERIAVQDGLAYVTAGVEGLLILDVTDPERTRLLSRLRTPCYPLGIEVQDRIVYLADGLCGGNSLLVIDARDPASPRILERLPGRVGNVRVSGDQVVSLGTKKVRAYSLPLP